MDHLEKYYRIVQFIGSLNGELHSANVPLRERLLPLAGTMCVSDMFEVRDRVATQQQPQYMLRTFGSAPMSAHRMRII